MARRPRLFLPNGIFHVYCRVARGEFVFDDRSEADEFIEHLRTVRDLDGWTIFAWYLMAVTKCLNRGLRLEHNDSDFRHRLDQIDAAISRLS